MAQHAASRPSPPPRHGRRWLIAALAVVALLLVAAGSGALYYSHNSSDSASASPKPKILPLNLLATTPSAGATNVASDTVITVDLSAPLASDSPMPTLAPAVTGTWQALS